MRSPGQREAGWAKRSWNRGEVDLIVGTAIVVARWKHQPAPHRAMAVAIKWRRACNLAFRLRPRRRPESAARSRDGQLPGAGGPSSLSPEGERHKKKAILVSSPRDGSSELGSL